MGLSPGDDAFELATRLALALGCGLLIGIERERRKGLGPKRQFAGVRTFTLTALLGAAAHALGQPLLVAVAALFVAGLGALAWSRSPADDPGATTEIALFVCFLLGVWAMRSPAVAAAGAVVVAGVLASRTALQHFSTQVLSEAEYRSALVLAAAALIVLPLLPREPVAWLAGLRPYTIWQLVVLIMVVQSLGHILLRTFRSRWGFGLAGFVSGFVSSTSTVGALGAKARRSPDLVMACAAGALFSASATGLQWGLLALVIDPRLLLPLAPMMLAAIATTTGFGIWALWSSKDPGTQMEQRDMYSLRQSVVMALVLSACTAGSHWIEAQLGPQALFVAAFVAGLADAHAPAAAVMGLAADNSTSIADMRTALLCAYTANAIVKCVMAWISGGPRYGTWVSLGVASAALAAWLAVWL